MDSFYLHLSRLLHKPRSEVTAGSANENEARSTGGRQRHDLKSLVLDTLEVQS